MIARIIDGKRESEHQRKQRHLSIRRKRESVRGKLMRELIADITASAGGHKLRNGELRKNPVEIEWICPKKYALEKIKLEHFEMEYLQPKTKTDNRVVLQLHGGGYIGPMKNIYRTFGVHYSKVLNGGSVLTIDYRVAPEHPFPAALEDAHEAYLWLVKQGYKEEEIVLAGDSAGGGLAMALIHLLKEEQRSLPSCIVLMSPWSDLTGSGESYITNFEMDPLFGNTRDSMLYNTDYLGENDPKNPLISPLFGDFTGFPPMLIQVGSCEMLLSDSVEVAKKAKKAGVKTRLTVYHGMFHEFQMAGILLPEARQAWEEIERMLEVLK